MVKTSLSWSRTLVAIWVHPFNTYAKCSTKLSFLIPRYTHLRSPFFAYVLNRSSLCQKSRHTSFCKAIDSFVLLAYASLEAWRNLFATINDLSELLFCHKKWLYWHEQRKLFLWALTAVRKAGNHWIREMRLDLIFTTRDMRINSSLNPLAKFRIKDILPRDISYRPSHPAQE